MKKHLMLFIAFAAIAVMLCGCGEHFPSVRIEEGLLASRIDIDVGNGLKYVGFDIETVDGGKDLILHFVEGSTGRVE